MSTEPKSNAEAAKPAADTALIADPWLRINVGSIVLCKDNSAGGGGWWPCKVTEVSKDGKSLSVKWEGYTDLPQFTIRRTAAALLSAKP